MAGIWSSITACAARDRTRVSLRHVCLACAQRLHVDGAALTLAVRVPRIRQAAFATDTLTEELEELQSTLGEGPGMDALAERATVLVRALAAPQSALRWPLFAPAAAARGIGSMFSFPLRSGEACVGVLDLYRVRAGPLSGIELADALAYADAAVTLAVDGAGAAERARATVDDLFDGRQLEVHQATGMVSVQLGLTVGDALARLRAHAYATDRRLSDVAGDVVARRLRFTPEGTVHADGIGHCGNGVPERRTSADPGTGSFPARPPVSDGQEDSRKDGAS